VGALSGWFGILLIEILANSKMQVLGGAFHDVNWYCPLAPFTLGLAFALGFSERLFDGIISSLEDKVDSDRKAATKPQQSTTNVNAGTKQTPPTGQTQQTGVQGSGAGQTQQTGGQGSGASQTPLSNNPPQTDDKKP
jgi:hypothetical protein